MDPIIGGSIISGIGNLFGNIFGANSQAAANEANSAEGRANRTQQLYMSNTAYVRAMEDMRTAGLNPALMFSSAGPASTGSGSSVTHQGFRPDMSGLNDAVRTAADRMMQKSQQEKIASDVELNKQTKKVQKANQQNIEAQTRINSAEAVKAEQRAKFLQEHPWMVPIQEVLGTSSSAVGQAAQGALMLKALKPSETSKEQDFSKLGNDEKRIIDSYNRNKYRRQLNQLP